MTPLPPPDSAPFSERWIHLPYGADFLFVFSVLVEARICANIQMAHPLRSIMLLHHDYLTAMSQYLLLLLLCSGIAWNAWNFHLPSPQLSHQFSRDPALLVFSSTRANTTSSSISQCLPPHLQMPLAAPLLAPLPPHPVTLLHQ